MNFLSKIKDFKILKLRSSFYSTSAVSEHKTISSEIELEKAKQIRPFSKDMLLSRFNLDLLEFPEIDNNDGVDRTKAVSIEIDKLMKTRASFNREVLLDKLSTTGIIGLTVPGAVAGGQYTWMMVARVIEALSEDVDYVIYHYLPQLLACQSVMEGGNDKQKDMFVRGLVEGRIHGFVAISEGRRSEIVNDDNSCATSASINNDGASCVINGVKTRVLNYRGADIVIVWATTPEGEVAPYIVNLQSEGISVVNSVNNNSYFSDIHFKNVLIPKENLLSNKLGLQLARYISSINNMAVSAVCSALIKSLMKQVNDFVCTRHIFGKPLSQFETIEAKIVDLSLEAYSCESVTYLTAGLIDNIGKENDLLLESAMSKIYCLESLRRCVDLSLNIVGVNCLSEPRFKELFDNANILFNSQVAPSLSRADSASESLKYVFTEIKAAKFSLFKTVSEIIGGYKIKAYLSQDNIEIISNSFKYNLHQRLGDLGDGVYKHFNTLTKFLERLSRTEAVEQQDLWLLGRLSRVLVDSLVMVAVLGRASRSICIGIKNHDLEVRLAEVVCERVTKRVEREVSLLKKYPENITEWNKVAKLLNEDGCNLVNKNNIHEKNI